ncbi:hypothetical protein L7F22_055959 [Adiantum nelumboides]|nr:hypothetical protein [Adiantum nelumboides]
MLIGGKPSDAASGRTFETQNPFTGAPWATVPDCGPDDVDTAVAAARTALDGEWGAMTPFARAACLRRLGDLITENAEALARTEVNDSGKLYREMIGQLNGLGGWYHYYAGIADDRGPPDPGAEPELPGLHAQGAGRRRRGDHAVELPAAADDLEGRARAGRRLHDRREAVGALARLDAQVGRADREGRDPGRCGQRRHHERPGHRRAPGRSPGRRQGRVHRLHRDRAVDRQGRRGEPEQGHPRAGRQVPAGRVPRRRPAGRRERPDRRRVRRDRPDLHGRVAPDRARRRPRRAGPPRRRARRDDQARRPERRGHRDGPGREQAAVREGAGLPGDGEGGGQHHRLRRGRGLRAGRLLRAADGDHRGDARVHGLPGGGVRPGARGGHLHRRGRGREAGQRHPVRPGRRGVDEGRAPRAPGRRPDPGRHGVDQRLPGGGAERAVRRVRALRARPENAEPIGPALAPLRAPRGGDPDLGGVAAGLRRAHGYLSSAVCTAVPGVEVPGTAVLRHRGQDARVRRRGASPDPAACRAARKSGSDHGTGADRTLRTGGGRSSRAETPDRRTDPRARRKGMRSAVRTSRARRSPAGLSAGGTLLGERADNPLRRATITTVRVRRAGAGPAVCRSGQDHLPSLDPHRSRGERGLGGAVERGPVGDGEQAAVAGTGDAGRGDLVDEAAALVRAGRVERQDGVRVRAGHDDLLLGEDPAAADRTSSRAAMPAGAAAALLLGAAAAGAGVVGAGAAGAVSRGFP